MGKKMSGASSLVKSLESAGVDVMFGIPGGAILPAYDPIFDSSIRHILVRHEQGAAFVLQHLDQVQPTLSLRLQMLPWTLSLWLQSLAKYHQMQLVLMHFKKQIFVESLCHLQSTII